MVAGPATLGNELTKDAARPRSRAQKGIVSQLLEFLASLKLTVLLFALWKLTITRWSCGALTSVPATNIDCT